MTKFKRSIALLTMACMLLILSAGVLAEGLESVDMSTTVAADVYSEGEENVTVSISLRVEGISDTVLSGDFDVSGTDSVTVLDAVKQILDENDISYTVGQYNYISEINGETEKTFNVNYDGWMYRVNGISPSVGMLDYRLEDNDSVLLYYGSMDIAYPEVTVDAVTANTLTVKVTYEKTEYLPPDYAPVTTTENLEGAIIKVNGEEYTTDENGKAIISLTGNEDGMLPLELEKYGDTAVDGKYLPLVVRLEDNFALSFTPVQQPVTTEPVYRPIQGTGSSSGGGISAVVTPAPEPEEPIIEEPEITPEVTVKPFTDVSGWSEEYIYYLAEKGILNGKTESEFAPEDNITRGEIITILARASGADLSSYENPFTDVESGSWYEKSAAWGYNTGIVLGFDGKFSPKDNVTREDLAVLLVRFSEYMEYNIDTNLSEAKFIDYDKIQDYAKDSVDKLFSLGIISGNGDGSFEPGSFATREQLAKIFAVLLMIQE